MITVHTLYDRAVHLDDNEYYTKTGERVNVQAEVEQPEVHMLVLGTSSMEDQASVIGDRLECLQEMRTSLKTSNGKIDMAD